MDLKSLLEDDNFLIGMGLLSAGSKGQSIGEAGLTSIKDAAAIKKSFAGTPKKTKAVFNTITGQSQFATESQIASSNGILIPVPKEDTTTNKTKAVKNTTTGEQEFATDKMILESNGILVPIKKEPLVKIEGDKQQTEFEKVMGKSEAEFVVDIRKDSDKAIDQNSELEIIGALSMELKSGKFGTSMLEVAKIGERVGIDMNWLSKYDSEMTVANAEVLQVLSSSMVLNAISKTKGSISDKEMSFFQSIAPNLGMSPEGIQKTVEITRKINERKILKSDLMNDWIADDGSGKKILPSTKKLVEKADGSTQMMTFNQMWSNYTKENALFDEEEIEELTSLAKSNPDGDNITIYKGKRYYILPGGGVKYINDIKK
tara:strand:+ start:749 stop:1867 length:1119 start_codon:yes stop_codon:yes gene_type:complete